MPLANGTRLGPYEILASIGAGGMGEVYKARDTRLDRVVAVKVSKQEFSQRFEREARTIAALSHPHICQLYDVGPNYLVMELVEGEPLKGPLPPEKAGVYAAQILDALDAAHKKGVVHRDLKPANILVTRQGIKLLDFGLAKAAPLKESDATLTSALTSQGQLLGTLQYMAPEQLQGKEADPRSDLFAFGCVLYEMLTGKRAFDGASAASVIAAIIEREPAPIGAVAPPALDQIVRRSLAKDPEQRWQTARDLHSALELKLEQAEPTRAKGLSLRIAICAAAVFAVLAGIGFWLLWHRPVPEERAIRFQVTAPPGGEFMLGPGGGSAISPDGRLIAFVAVSLGMPKLWIRPLDSLSARELPGTDEPRFPFWSPDSQSLGFFAGGKLKRIDLAGGSSAILADAPAPRGGTWSQDGTILFAPGTVGALQRVPAGGGTATPVTAIDAAAQESSHRWPVFLPGGRRFLYFSLTHDPHRNAIFLGSLDLPSQKTRLIESTAAGYYIPPRGADPGYLLWLRQEALVVRPFDPKTARFTGEAVPVPGAEAVSFISGNYYVGISASIDGAILFSSGSERYRLSWFTREGKPLSSVGQPDRYNSLRISPDAGRVVISVSSPTGERDASTIDFARGVQTRLTSGGTAINAFWSPDGRRIVYYDINGTSIYERSASGTGQPEAILNSTHTVYADDWSPDGRYLLYEELNAESHANLWLLPRSPAGPGERKPVVYLKTSSSQSNAQFSPDGKWIAYTSDESGRQEVYVQGFPAGESKWQVSGSSGDFARWRRDGKELLYRALDGKLMVASVRAAGQGLEFGTPAPLFRITEPVGPHTYPYDVAPDGQRILALTTGTEDNSTTLNVLLNWQAALKR